MWAGRVSLQPEAAFGLLDLFADWPDLSSPEKLFEHLFSPESLNTLFRERFALAPSKGIDRVNGFQFAPGSVQALTTASRKCLDGTYRFAPYLEKLQSKGRDKAPRVISIPTIRDRIVLHQLNKLLASVFPDCVPRTIANSYIRAITNDFANLSPDVSHVCGCDIKTFYDSIVRGRLTKTLDARLSGPGLKLIGHAIATPTVPKNARRRNYYAHARPRGIPQGLAISNILAAIYMSEVDIAMSALGVKYSRYVDDVLMYGSEEKVRAAHRSLAARLRRRGLGLHKLGTGKSHLGPLNEPFGYLGYYFALPRVTVREASIERLLQSIVSKFSDYTHNKTRRLERAQYLNEARLAEIFLLELNERISGAISEKKRYGWIAYYSQINDLSLLRRLDSAVAGMFRRLPTFNRTAPAELKRFSRAYFEMRFSPADGYVRNYDAISTRAEKLQFLLQRGRVNPSEALTDEQITARFDSYRRYILSQMHADEQFVY
jgi:RNA-directed DNA polymerase